MRPTKLPLNEANDPNVRLPHNDIQVSSMSFRDYKIDYTKCLGEGKFGIVYEIIPRPENEKGILAEWFPYIYDSIFQPNKSNEESRKYCVKISKTAIRVFLENRNRFLPLQLPIASFFEASAAIKTHNILQKHSMTKIRFFPMCSLYSQFRTIVHGQTLSFHDTNESFAKRERFKFRQAFVAFLKAIESNRLLGEDIHTKNIIYDEDNEIFEIIDGDVTEDNDASHKGYPSHIMFLWGMKESTQLIIGELLKISKENIDYTQEIDSELIRKIENNELSQKIVTFYNC